MVPDSEGMADEGLPATNGCDPMKAIEGGRRYDDEGDKVPEMTDEPMKTMAELAAEHAERQRQLGFGSTKGSKLSNRRVRSSRVRRKAADGGSGDEPELDEDEDLSEPSLSDYLSDSPAPNKQKATSSRAPSRTNPRSSARSNPKPSKKRARSPEVDEGPGIEYDGSSRSKSTSAGSHPRRKTTTGAAKATTRAIRAVSGSSATSIAVPASDRVLRSRKARV